MDKGINIPMLDALQSQLKDCKTTEELEEFRKKHLGVKGTLRAFVLMIEGMWARRKADLAQLERVFEEKADSDVNDSPPPAYTDTEIMGVPVRQIHVRIPGRSLTPEPWMTVSGKTLASMSKHYDQEKDETTLSLGFVDLKGTECC